MTIAEYCLQHARSRSCIGEIREERAASSTRDDAVGGGGDAAGGGAAERAGRGEGARRSRRSRRRIANLAHENQLLKRRLFGNKTERSHTSELQLALGDLLAAETRLQKELDAAVAKAKQDAGGDGSGPAHGRSAPSRRAGETCSRASCRAVLVEILDEELEAKGVPPHRLRGQRAADVPARRLHGAGQAGRASTRSSRTATTTAVTVPTPETLFPRALLHTSTVAHLMVSKFGLGVPHYRLERDVERPRRAAGSRDDEPLRGAGGQHAGRDGRARDVGGRDRERAGDLDRRDRGADPADEGRQGRARRRARRGTSSRPSSTATRVLFAYVEHHSSESVKKLFDGFRGYCKPTRATSTTSSSAGRPTDTDEGVTLVGCFAHCRRYFFEAAICRYPSRRAGTDADPRDLRRRRGRGSRAAGGATGTARRNTCGRW